MTIPRVGIDVSKPILDIFDEAVGAPERIDNTRQAIAERLPPWRQGDVFVVFEATGSYDAELTQALQGSRHSLCPHQSRPGP